MMGGRIARALVAVCVAAAFSGCTSDDSPDPAPTESGAKLDIAAVRGALLQPKDVGATWTVPQRSPASSTLVSLCGGDPVVPAVPGRPTLAASAMVDEGEGGAQSLDQIALVYDSTAAATAGLGALRGVADACPATVVKPSADGDATRLVGYTETVTTSNLNPQGFSGFVVIRHRQYEAQKPAIGDTAVAVVATRNVVYQIAYTINRLGAQSTGPQFTTDWKRLVGTALKRVPA